MAGVIYDPVRDEMFTAILGQGAYLNGERIAVSESRELSRCLLSFDLGYVDEKAGLALDMVRSLWPGMYSIRMMGTAGLGLAYAASGRVDLFFHHSLSPWDLATGLLLIREAGGVVVDRQGATAGLSQSQRQSAPTPPWSERVPERHRRPRLAHGVLNLRGPCALLCALS